MKNISASSSRRKEIPEKDIRVEFKEKNLTCYLCGSPKLRTKYHSRHRSIEQNASIYSCTSFGHGQHEEIIECLECGLVALKERPSMQELENEYRQVVDPLYSEEKEGRYLTFRNVVKEVQKYVPSGKLLDVGCYCGYFLDVAREARYEVEGLELSTWAAEQARLLGLSIHSDTLSCLPFDENYVAVTLWDVIEHLSDPREELLKIHRLLKKDGYLFLSTINVGSLLARLMGPRWPWLMDMHIFYFTPKTITRLLEQTGFHLVRIHNYTHIISSEYFIKKLSHISHIAELVVKILQKLFGEHKIPFNLGDNMMVVAKKGEYVADSNQKGFEID